MPEHFSDEQRGWLQERRALVGDARIREVEAEWPRLIAEVREEMTKGTPPDAPRAIALAQRWTSLVEEFTNGNLGIAKAVATRYSEEPALRQKTGIDSAMMDYISRAGAFRTLPRE